MTPTEIIIVSLDSLLVLALAGLIIFSRTMKSHEVDHSPRDMDWLLSKGDISKLNKSIPVEGCRGNT